MKYLSFDIECCDGKHICEFGYVIVDEAFNVLERDCITINPEHKFRLTGREKESDISLAFPEEVYYDSPSFDFYYERIKSILTTPDCQIIGFSLSNDAGFLATAYDLYEKEAIPFSFLDFQKLYQGYVKSKNRTSVGGFVTELQIPNIRLHKSDDDAWAVIMALKVISERENLTLAETLKMLQKRKNNYKAEKAKEHNLALIDKLNRGDMKAQNEFMKNFIRNLALPELPKDEFFFGKCVCISSHFQKNCFNEFLSLIESLYSYGATYSGKASTCDIFIEYQIGDELEVRKASAIQAVEANEREIDFISLEEALAILGLIREDLSKVDHINSRLHHERDKRKNRSYIDVESRKTTIGELLQCKGIKIEV
jgi:hypothetical protein